MLSQDELKKRVGIYAADFVKNGATIGLGTGSTVYWLIEELGKRVKQGLEIIIVPTSAQTAELAKAVGITVSSLDEIEKLSLTIDGADEIDPKGQLIKGGGGALLQEKIVASAVLQSRAVVQHEDFIQNLVGRPNCVGQAQRRVGINRERATGIAEAGRGAFDAERA